MKDEQEQQILDALQSGLKSINELSALLYVSPSTVRRKLNHLANKKLVIRTHGGAILNAENSIRPSFSFRTHENVLEKKKIALSAIKLINNGDFVFLDGTTSSFFISEYLDGFSDIKVMTNGIDTLSRLAKSNIDVYSTGGSVSRENRSALVGSQAIDAISGVYADIAFFSSRAVRADGEIFDVFDEENAIRNCMRMHAKKTVFLCDSTKLGNSGSFRLCSLSEVDFLICEKDIRGYFTTDKLPPILFG